MKLSILFAAIILLFITSCKKDKDIAGGGAGTGKIELMKGDNQSGVYGELLKDTFQIKITSPYPKNHFKVTYTLLQGNGMVEELGNNLISSFYLDSAGTIKFRWRMGCDYAQQKIKLYVYSDTLYFGPFFNAAPADSLIITANAVKPTGWCRSCGYGNLDIYLSKIVTADNNTLYLLNRDLFSSTDGGLNWYKVNGAPHFDFDEIIDAQFNSKKEMFLLTRKHGVYYSRDLQQWTAINNGLLDLREPTGFLVEDTAAFVSFYNDGPYRTTNNGGFWKKLIVDVYSQHYYHFQRHPNGKLMMFEDSDNLMVSDNNGDNWSDAPLPDRFQSHNVYDFKIDANGVLYIGTGDANISEVDGTTYQGTLHSYYQWNASSQHVNNITLTGNDVYYLVNYTPSPGIYRKSNNWGLVNTGFNDQINYYFLKSNSAFLIGSKGWLYYNR
jgi:hypothetical protein